MVNAFTLLGRVTLSNALPGEAPPEEQRQLSDEERERKLAVVFDAAMDELCSYWNRLKFDGFPVLSRKVSCLSEEEFCALETCRAIEEFLYASEKAIKEKPALQGGPAVPQVSVSAHQPHHVPSLFHQVHLPRL